MKKKYTKKKNDSILYGRGGGLGQKVLKGTKAVLWTAPKAILKSPFKLVRGKYGWQKKRRTKKIEKRYTNASAKILKYTQRRKLTGKPLTLQQQKKLQNASDLQVHTFGKLEKGKRFGSEFQLGQSVQSFHNKRDQESQYQKQQQLPEVRFDMNNFHAKRAAFTQQQQIAKQQFGQPYTNQGLYTPQGQFQPQGYSPRGYPPQGNYPQGQGPYPQGQGQFQPQGYSPRYPQGQGQFQPQGYDPRYPQGQGQGPGQFQPQGQGPAPYGPKPLQPQGPAPPRYVPKHIFVDPSIQIKQELDNIQTKQTVIGVLFDPSQNTKHPFDSDNIKALLTSANISIPPSIKQNPIIAKDELIKLLTPQDLQKIQGLQSVLSNEYAQKTQQYGNISQIKQVSDYVEGTHKDIRTAKKFIADKKAEIEELKKEQLLNPNNTTINSQIQIKEGKIDNAKNLISNLAMRISAQMREYLQSDLAISINPQIHFDQLMKAEKQKYPGKTTAQIKQDILSTTLDPRDKNYKAKFTELEQQKRIIGLADNQKSKVDAAANVIQRKRNSNAQTLAEKQKKHAELGEVIQKRPEDTVKEEKKVVEGEIIKHEAEIKQFKSQVVDLDGKLKGKQEELAKSTAQENANYAQKKLNLQKTICKHCNGATIAESINKIDAAMLTTFDANKIQNLNLQRLEILKEYDSAKVLARMAKDTNIKRLTSETDKVTSSLMEEKQKLKQNITTTVDQLYDAKSKDSDLANELKDHEEYKKLSQELNLPRL
jgi:hypothetical protein